MKWETDLQNNSFIWGHLPKRLGAEERLHSVSNGKNKAELARAVLS